MNKIVRDSARIKYVLMCVMVYFKLEKINTNYCYESNSVHATMAGIDGRMLDKIQADYNTNAYRYKRQCMIVNVHT
jgi:hypothetical protein